MNGKRMASRTIRLLAVAALATWLVLAAESPVRAGGAWTNQAPTPSARVYHAMADLGDDQVLLFGGWDVNRNAQTWLYDRNDNTWTNQAPAGAPSPRSGHAMAYAGGDQVLLFGGNDGEYAADTWVYDLGDNTWTDQAPAVRPSAREGHAMAYLGGGQALLFGGYRAGASSGETWLAAGFGSGTWRQTYLPLALK